MEDTGRSSEPGTWPSQSSEQVSGAFLGVQRSYTLGHWEARARECLQNEQNVCVRRYG